MQLAQNISVTSEGLPVPVIGRKIRDLASSLKLKRRDYKANETRKQERETFEQKNFDTEQK